MGASLRQVRFVEKAGEPDTRYASLSFTEYRDWAGTDYTEDPPPPTPAPPATTPARLSMRYNTASDSWTIKATNAKNEPLSMRWVYPLTLANIAQVFYGTRKSEWRRIRTASALGKWGPNSPLRSASRFKNKEGVLVVPQLPPVKPKAKPKPKPRKPTH
jgi:hypothetical protein